MNDASKYLPPAEIEAIRKMLAIRATMSADEFVDYVSALRHSAKALLAHRDALSAPADGEALGRDLYMAIHGHATGRIFDTLPDEAKARMNAAADHLDARGHARGRAERDAERDAAIADVLAANARLTAELAEANAYIAHPSLTHSVGSTNYPTCGAEDALYVTSQDGTVTCPKCARADGAHDERERLTGELSIEFERLSRAEHDRGERFPPGDAEGDAHDAARDAYSEAAKIVRAKGDQ